MGVRQLPSSEREPVEPESRVRATLGKHFDTLVAIGISAAIFSSAYFFRIAPQLKNLDGQMVAVSSQLTSVNKGLARMNNNEIFRLRLTSRDLQHRMEEVITRSTAVAVELSSAATEVTAVRAKLAALDAALAGYQSMVSKAATPLETPLPDIHAAAREVVEKIETAEGQLGPKGKKFPDLYGQAAALSARLDAAEKSLPAKRKFPALLDEAEALAQKIDAAGAKVDSKKRPFPDVNAAARDLHADIQRLRKELKGSFVACGELNPALLKQLKKAGHCK
jgi:chromosome segregation ATPase